MRDLWFLLLATVLLGAAAGAFTPPPRLDSSRLSASATGVPSTPVAYLPLAVRRSSSPTIAASEPSPSETPASTPTVIPTSPPTTTVTATVTVTPAPTSTPRNPWQDRLRPRAALSGDECAASFDEQALVYRFECEGRVRVRFELELTHPDNAAGRLAVREAYSGRYPIAGGGLYYRRLDESLVEPRLLGAEGSVDRIDHEMVDGALRLTVHETLEGQPHVKRYVLKPVSGALLLRAESLDTPDRAAGHYAGFTTGDIEGTRDGVNVRIPYMDMVPVTMLDHRWFASTLLDYTASFANSFLPRGPEARAYGFVNEVAALYAPNVEGKVQPVTEEVWVTLSPDVADTFPVPSAGPSASRAELGRLAHITLAGGSTEASFADEAAYLRQLAAFGAGDIVVHKRDWRSDGALFPAQGPADPVAGGEAGLHELSRAANRRLALDGMLTVTDEPCPAESNPLYDPADRIRGPDGVVKRLDDEHGGRRACGDATFAGRYLLAPDALQKYVAGQVSELKDLGGGGITVGASAAWNPAYPIPGASGSLLGFGADPVHAATAAEAISYYKAAFDELQRTLGAVYALGAHGPWDLRYDSLYAGYIDAAERPLSTGGFEGASGASYLVVPDYELAVVRPRMVGYGMGDYASFFGVPSDPGGSLPLLTDAQLDEWRATELSYGHAAAWTARVESESYVGSALALAEELKEYYLIRPVQEWYLAPGLPTVGYLTPSGEELDLSAALKRDMSLAEPRLHLTYPSGLELWINHGASAWQVEVGPERVLLPQHGWVVRGPDGLLGYSALVEGHRVDYLWSRDWLVLDGRGVPTRFGTMEACDLKVVFADGRVLEEQPDGSLVIAP